MRSRAYGRRMALGRRAQRGAVLVVGLLILLVLTLIGVTAMRGATLEERMAANATFTQQALQAADSAAEAAMRQNHLASAISLGLSNELELDGSDIDLGIPATETAVTVAAEIFYRSKNSFSEGWSAGIGKGFTEHNFDIVGIGRIPAANAEQVVTRGAMARGPAEELTFAE